MAKRSATTELNHDNWNQEEEPEDPGTFKTLNQAQLKNRVFAKAKRSLGSNNSSNSGSSPFAGFGGFTSDVSSNSFSFLQKNDIFGSKSESDTKAVQKTENGKSLTVPETKTEATNQNQSMSQTIFGNKSLETSLNYPDNNKNDNSSVTDEKATKDSPMSSSANKEKPKRNIEYYRQLKSLNESVLKWIQLHLSKNAWCDFTPVFNDYKKHMDSLNVTFPIQKKESVVETDLAFKSPKENSDSADSATYLPSNFSKDETDYGAHFSSNTTNTSTFSFGHKTIPSITSSGSTGPTSSFKEGAAGEKKNTSQFSFGLKKGDATDQEPSNKPFSFAISAPSLKASEGGAEEAAEYVPPKNDFQAVTEEDAIYSKRCKLYFKKDEAYVDKGIGTLYLKPLNDKTQLLIRADTNLGNILLNIMLSASLPMSRSGKNNVLLVCIPNPPVDKKESQNAIPMLIRVKTAEDADELLEKLNAHKS